MFVVHDVLFLFIIFNNTRQTVFYIVRSCYGLVAFHAINKNLAGYRKEEYIFSAHKDLIEPRFLEIRHRLPSCC